MKTWTKSLITLGAIGTATALITTTSIIASQLIYQNHRKSDFLKVVEMKKIGEINNQPDQIAAFHYYLQFIFNKEINDSGEITNITGSEYDGFAGQGVIFFNSNMIEIEIHNSTSHQTNPPPHGGTNASLLSVKGVDGATLRTQIHWNWEWAQTPTGAYYATHVKPESITWTNDFH